MSEIGKKEEIFRFLNFEEIDFLVFRFEPLAKPKITSKIDYNVNDFNNSNKCIKLS